MILTTIIRKEALHLKRDPQTLLVAVCIPVVLLLLFGFAISTEVNNVRVAAVVTEHNDRTRDICMRLQTNPYFTFAGLAAFSDIDRLLRTSEVDAVIVLDTDGGKLSTQIVTDASNTVLAQSAQAYLQNVVTAKGGDPAKPPILTEILYNPRLKSAYNFVPGILGMIFILICAIMTSVSIVSERESGTMDLMLVSPVRPHTVILGKLIPYFILSCLILALMLTISYTALGLPFSARVVDVVLLSLVYILLSLSVGLLVSTLVDTEVAALIVSAIAFMIPVIMLSGMIFPVDNMPRPLQWLSCIVPARWYISAMRKLMIQQLTPGGVWLEATILCGMTAMFLTLAVKKFKSRI